MVLFVERYINRGALAPETITVVELTGDGLRAIVATAMSHHGVNVDPTMINLNTFYLDTVPPRSNREEHVDYMSHDIVIVVRDDAPRWVGMGCHSTAEQIAVKYGGILPPALKVGVAIQLCTMVDVTVTT